MAGKANGGSYIGHSVPRLEAWAKLTGRAEYVHTLRLPGMLHGKIVRSTLAHGRIRGIDTKAALALPGVARAELPERKSPLADAPAVRHRHELRSLRFEIGPGVDEGAERHVAGDAREAVEPGEGGRVRASHRSAHG